MTEIGLAHGQSHHGSRGRTENGHDQGLAPLSAVAVPESGRIVVVAGPEGGISPEELEVLTGAGARAVRLGAEVLRTSTAGVVAVAALLSRTGRWA